MAVADKILNSTWSYDFPINDSLHAYMWSHQTDPQCEQLERDAKQVRFQRIEELPVIVHAAFGKKITMREEATMTAVGFDTKVHGNLPGAHFESTMNFIGVDAQKTNAKVDVVVTWNEGVADFIKASMRTFISAKVASWCNSLPTRLEEYKHRR